MGRIALRMMVTWLWLAVASWCVSAVAENETQSVLVDQWGIEHDWSAELTVFPERKARAYAIVFLDKSCPIVTRLSPTLNELQSRYAADRVQFLGIYSNEGTTRLEMASHKQKLDLSFPVFLDVGGQFARRLKARATPEAFLLDEHLKVRYRGMVNDAGWKKMPTKAPTNYLDEAIQALLRGTVDIPETRAQGCELQLPPLERPLPKRPLTYYDDAGPIVNRHCVVCHNQGGIGGFPLDSFESVKQKAATVRREVEYQRMPPWQADSTRGRPIHGVLALSDADRTTIVDWIEQGLVRHRQGDADWLVAGKEPEHGLPLPQLPRNHQFTIGGGVPDYVVSMQRPFIVKAFETIDYQYFWVPNDFRQDHYIQEVEMLPGDRRVVHHMQVFLIDRHERPADTSKPMSGVWMMSKLNGVGGVKVWRIASYTPGDQYSTRRFAPDEGIHVPAGYDIVFEMHYTPVDEDVADQSSIGFVWRKSPDPPEKILNDYIFYRDRSIEVRPHEPHVRTEFYPYFKQNIVLVDVRPHMHLRGADFQVSAIFPDGREELLVAVPAFDFNWQRRYVFREPLKLPAGSTLKVVGHWNNSRLNPNNPDPSATVTFGEGSADEMSNLVVTYRIDQEAEAKALRQVASPVPK